VLILGSLIHFVIPDWKQTLIIFAQYALAIVISTTACHVLTEYLWRSHVHYKKLKEFAQKDYLTGLNNVRSFHDALNAAYSKVIDLQGELSLLMIDIDYFKQINDSYGHPAGDQILKQLAEILLHSCRYVDIVSRNGGEEFSIIMPVCDANSARALAQRIHQAVEKYVFVINNNKELNVTVSIGFATINSKNNRSVLQLIQQADQGLYKAKQSGRNRISPPPFLENQTI
jgi:diguanylate cyclase